MLDLDNVRGKTILDFGCGSAKAGVVFAKAGATVVGFDVSHNAIVTGRRRAAVNGVERDVGLCVMTGDRLGLRSETFDYVFGYEVLYYLQGDRFSQEILRVLKPGGRAIFCEALDGNPLLRAVRTVARWATRSINRTGGRALRMDDIHALFGRARVATYPVNLLGMGKRFFPKPDRIGRMAVGMLKRFDRVLLNRLPGIRPWCGEVVIVVTK